MCDDQLVRGVVFEQHRRAAVAERLLDIADDLLQKNLEIERRADSLRDTLKQQEFLDLLVHRTVATRVRLDIGSLEHRSFPGARRLAIGEFRRAEIGWSH
jgi:hypothetical protein